MCAVSEFTLHFDIIDLLVVVAAVIVCLFSSSVCYKLHVNFMMFAFLHLSKIFLNAID